LARGPALIAHAEVGAAVSVAPTLYIGNDDVSQGTVTPISTATNKPGKAIKVGFEPLWIAITP
jgi:DNA-binding beta-propeller fold protein YncE